MAPRCFNNLKKAATSLSKSLITQDFWAGRGIKQLAQQRNNFHNIPVVYMESAESVESVESAESVESTESAESLFFLLIINMSKISVLRQS